MKALLSLLALFFVLTVPFSAHAQNAPCPVTHYQCSPGVCCPR